MVDRKVRFGPAFSLLRRLLALRVNHSFFLRTACRCATATMSRERPAHSSCLMPSRRAIKVCERLQSRTVSRVSVLLFCVRVMRGQPKKS